MSINRTILLAVICSLFGNNLQAQDLYDITKAYLANPGFDSHFDYTIDDTGNVAQEILNVEGWTKNISVNYTITGTYQIGTKKTFNGASVPATGQDGSSEGGVLALSTGWNQSLLFYQSVSLPPGNYALVSAWYNSVEQTAGHSRVGWKAIGHATNESAVYDFPTGEWFTDTIFFSLETTTKGIIQIGFQANADMGSAHFAKPVLDFVKLLRDTPMGKDDMDLYKTQLQDLINEATTLYGNGNGNEAAALLEAIQAAQAVMDNDEATPDDVDEAMAALRAAMDSYLWANPTGKIPVVTTDKRYARGATMAFGRMNVSGIPTNQISEQGFCFSEQSEPTINDERATRYLSNNGNIYWLENLKPATQYYMRAYAITNGRQVGYGDIIRFYTIPKGQITFSIRGSGDAAADERICAAANTAVNDYWNQLTEMKGFSTSIGYNPGVPTAECSYGGWMSVGSNQSYQRPGTIMHEMLHGIGVIPWANTEWSRFDLRSGTSNAAGYTTGSGYWLGDRVTDVLRFWDNSSSERLNGDYQHMWPYGINGASEDNGSDLLYIGNSLVCQALGEDGLQHTSQLFAEPYWAFEHEEGVKYYIKNEDPERGLYTAFLLPSANNTLCWRTMENNDVIENDSAAWYLTFTPNNQYYQLRNAATGQYITYSSNSFKTIERTTPTAFEDFQLMRSRINVGSSQERGYWLIHPTTNWNPPTLQANTDGSVGSAAFNISNSSIAQRWLILTADGISSLTDNLLAAMKTQADQLLSRVKALTEVPHSEDEAGTDEAINQKMEELTQTLQAATSNTEIQNIMEEAEDAAFQFLSHATPTNMDQPFDLSYLIQNAGMDATEGWSDSPTLNYSCGEYYERTFDLNQTIRHLPAGTYQWRAQGFQRPGRAEECASAAVTALIYAGSKSTHLAHATDCAQQSKLGGNESYVNGGYIPNNMEAASIYFSKGLYENRITTSIETSGGQLKAGIRCGTMNSYYWVIFDNFRLCYFGSLTPDEVDGIDFIELSEKTTTATGVYSLDGRLLLHDASEIGRLPRGLYLIGGKAVVAGGK